MFDYMEERLNLRVILRMNIDGVLSWKRLNQPANIFRGQTRLLNVEQHVVLSEL